MSYPQEAQRPVPPQAPYGYGQPPAPTYPQPGYAPGYGQPQYQQPVSVAIVGKAVTKPAWTLGQVLLLVFTCGLAYPLVWLIRRSKTTVTRYR